ncbi:nuclear transport factor 2 family protein [Nonomuraea roseola]|uniref:nuclear transport factor 2 family protein n=1 Tax=Nonomuraea roseola TaxID=46179 RepID=UPI0031F83E9C
MDRYYTPDMIQIADGIRIDRDRLIAHIRPVRKNLTHYRLEVHEALASGIASPPGSPCTGRCGRRRWPPRCTSSESWLLTDG